MKIQIEGHDRRYAVEQAVVVYFPGKSIEYSVGDDWDVKSSLRRTARTVRCVTSLRHDGGEVSAAASAAIGDGNDAVEAENLTVKLSFYRAVRKTGQRPPWGALTGVRPAKLGAKLLSQGISPEDAQRTLRLRYGVGARRAKMCIDVAELSIKTVRSLSERDILLYVSIPFCPTRCRYCSFVSHSIEKASGLLDTYLSALQREIRAAAASAAAARRCVKAVYIGGGTPTTLSSEKLYSLISLLRQSFSLPDDLEFTVEAGRPDTIDAEKLRVMKELGVTRVSVNPQSMDDAVLAAAGRPHTRADLLRAYFLAREAGFRQVNMDLILGLEGDTPEGFRSSLREVLALSPENITIHTLAKKRGSYISLEGADGGFTKPLKTADWAHNMLYKSGHRPYYMYRQKYSVGNLENTGYSLPGGHSVYNICMMEELCPTLAVGAGGISKLLGGGRIRRVCNPKYPYEYISGIEDIVNRKRGLWLGV